MKPILRKLIATVAMIGGLFTQQAMGVDEMILHYEFNETSGTTISDSSASAANGTEVLSGGNAWDVDGIYGGGYQLDNSHVDIPLTVFNDNLEGTRNASLSFWFKGASNNTAGSVQVTASNAAGGIEMRVFIIASGNSNIYMDFGANDTTSYDRTNFLPSGSPAWDGKWHHYAFTKNAAGEMKVYIDKALKHTGTGFTRNFGTVTNFTIGGLNSYRAKGRMDNLRVHNYALTLAEIQALDAITEVKDDTISTVYDNPKTFNVKDNNLNGSDHDPSSSDIVLGNTTGLKGTLSNIDLTTGEMTFNPTAGVAGVSTFDYTLNGKTATVTITDYEGAPTADGYQFDQGTTPQVLDVTANDTENDTSLPIYITEELPTNAGILSLDGTNKILTYTPKDTFAGTTTFKYSREDGGPEATVTIKTKGLIFHYKLDEEPGATVVVDSMGNYPNSFTLNSSNVLQGTDINLGTERRYLTHTGVTKNTGVGIAQSFTATEGLTYVAWIKPPTSSNDYINIMGSTASSPNSLTINTGNILGTYWGQEYRFAAGGATPVTAPADKWSLVALTVDTINGTGTVYAGLATGTEVQSSLFSSYGNEFKTNYLPNMRICDSVVGVRLYQGPIRDVRMYNYVLTKAELDVLLNNEKNAVLTPAIGLEFVQEGRELTWTLDEEVGVIRYEIVVNGEVVATIDADGSTSYTHTLDSDGKAELVVVDNHGSQTYLPIDGNLVTTPYELVQGWNLIAITGDNANIAPLVTAANGPLWAWNGSNYVKATAPVATQALWIDAEVSKRVDVTAEKSDAKVSLTPGWSLVGPTNNEKVPTEAMSVFSYDKIYNEITEQNKVLIRGVGYWIFSL